MNARAARNLAGHDARARRSRGAALAAAALAAGLLLGAASCDDAAGEPDPTPPRAGRFGSLRDLVLFERTWPGADGPLFVDRFEVTIGDWRGFAATADGRKVGADEVPTIAGDSLPVGFVDLRHARAFARWRFLRLPRADEWRFVCAGDGRSTFPWGVHPNWTRANTGELGLGQPTPVGTFESGRRAGADQPYDVVGNVSEWTETVAESWWGEPELPSHAAIAARDALRATPALMVWQLPGGITPPTWLAAAGGPDTARLVVGSDFQTPMQNATDLEEAVPAGERRSRTGLRLCATATELVRALAADTAPVAPIDATQLRRFVQRGRHRGVLLAAWERWLAAGGTLGAEHALGALLDAELRAGGPR